LEGADWIHLDQDRNQWRVLVNDLSSWNFFNGWVFISFSRNTELRGVSYGVHMINRMQGKWYISTAHSLSQQRYLLLMSAESGLLIRLWTDVCLQKYMDKGKVKA
jgi:hypothetical protein